MTVNQMKLHLFKMYDGKRWKEKVSKMSEGQVIAVYHRNLQKKQFNKPVIVAAKVSTELFHQMTLYECGLQKGYSYES